MNQNWADRNFLSSFKRNKLSYDISHLILFLKKKVDIKTLVYMAPLILIWRKHCDCSKCFYRNRIFQFPLNQFMLLQTSAAEEEYDKNLVTTKIY